MDYFKWCYRSFRLSNFIKNFLACLGGELTILKITDLLYKDFLQNHKIWFWFSVYVLALFFALYKAIPKKSITCRLSKKDIAIEIKIGDIFKVDNNTWYIIPIDTRFEVGLTEGKNLKMQKSVLACLVNKYFSGNQSELQKQIDSKKGYKCEIGDVVHVFYGGNNFLFLANTVKTENSDKVKQDENTLDNSLYGLWSNLANICENETIAIPLLNTGYAGNHNSRLDVIKKIIHSFIASTQSGNVYCNHLIISVSEKDFYNNIQDDFEKIQTYLKYMCEFWSDIKLKSEGSAEPNIRTL